MKTLDILSISIISAIIFFTVTIAVTEIILSSKIYFSLFIGIPAGIIASIITFIVLYIIFKERSSRPFRKN